MGNVPFRTSFDPRMSEPSMQYGTGLMGPLHEDASGILAGMKVGAGLGGLFQPYLHSNSALRLQNVLATRKVLRSIYEPARDVARTLAKTQAFAQSRRDRKKVEMLFAHLKRILRLSRLRLRGPSGAQFEFTLAAIAQNLRRLAKLVARPPPFASVACVA